MKYTITLLPTADEKRAKLLARVIQSKTPGISFSEIAAVLLTEEYKAGSRLDKASCEQLRRQFDDLGAEYRVDAEPEEQEIPKPAPEPVKKSIPEPQTISAAPAPIRFHTPVPPKPEKRYLPELLTLIFLIAAAGIAFVVMIGRKNSDPITIPAGEPLIKNGSGTEIPSGEPVPANMTKQEQQSRKYLDSADQKCISGSTDTEAFYQFAISFNRKNRDAWFGLLNCMRITKREKEAEDIEKEMKALFGESILDPSAMPGEYGEMETGTIAKPSVFIVLKTETKAPQIYSDLFQLSRRYASLGTFTSLKILVKHKDGTGLFAAVSPLGCLSYHEFLKQSKIEEIH